LKDKVNRFSSYLLIPSYRTIIPSFLPRHTKAHSTPTMSTEPHLRLAEFSAFKPIHFLSHSSDNEEPLSPLAIFRDAEHSMGLPFVCRANPVESMDCSHGSSSEDCFEEETQRVISPFPAGGEDDMMPPSAADLVEEVNFSHFFPSVNVMECDDFSLSSAEASDDLILEDFGSPESFWEIPSDSRSPSPAQISVGSSSLSPVSPISTIVLHEVETPTMFTAKQPLPPC
jgi:hypothetical protein